MEIRAYADYMMVSKCIHIKKEAERIDAKNAVEEEIECLLKMVRRKDS